MKLGIDLDGVVYPFTEVFKKYAERQLGRHLPNPTTWNFPVDQWGMTWDQFGKMMADSVKRYHLWWTGDPEPGSGQVIDQLRRRGAQITYITDRSPKGAEEAAHTATRAWLIANHLLGRGDELVITKDKPSVGVDVLVDDAPHNIAAMHEAGQKAIVFHRPWNENMPFAAPRIRTFAELPLKLRALGLMPRHQVA